MNKYIHSYARTKKRGVKALTATTGVPDTIHEVAGMTHKNLPPNRKEDERVPD